MAEDIEYEVQMKEYRERMKEWISMLEPNAIQYAIDMGYIDSKDDLYELEWMNLAVIDGKYQESINNEIDVYWWMGNIPGEFMNINLKVGGYETGIPHFHFYRGIEEPCSIENKGRGGGCICFQEPLYLFHGSHKDVMSPEEIDSLMEFLKLELESHGTMSVWEWMVSIWNDNNEEGIQLPRDLKIPDYKSDMPSIQE